VGPGLQTGPAATFAGLPPRFPPPDIASPGQ
jgi:hypothetical protein